MGASVQVTVPVDCIATVDTRGLPLDDRGIATDPDRNNPVADGKETSDFANIEYVYERGEIVGAKIAPHSGYAQAGVNTMTFVVFSRKMLPK